MVKAPKSFSVRGARFEPFCHQREVKKVLRRSLEENVLQEIDHRPVSDERQELRNLYQKLRDVIPSCQTKPVTSVDIVLGAVDYIRNLHSMLEDKLVESGKADEDLLVLRNLCGPERVGAIAKEMS